MGDIFGARRGVMRLPGLLLLCLIAAAVAESNNSACKPAGYRGCASIIPSERCCPGLECHDWVGIGCITKEEAAAKGFVAANHSTIYIIRHGEKTWSGGCLSPPGQERANVLETIFNGVASSKHSTFATPTQMFADQYHEVPECERCWLTVEPLAQYLNLSTTFTHGHNFNGGNAASAAAIREASLTQPVILVAWEHHNIQFLTADLGVKKSNIPDWSGSDYDTVYELKLDSKGALSSFEVHKQNYTPCSGVSNYAPCK